MASPHTKGQSFVPAQQPLRQGQLQWRAPSVSSTSQAPVATSRIEPSQSPGASPGEARELRKSGESGPALILEAPQVEHVLDTPKARDPFADPFQDGPQGPSTVDRRNAQDPFAATPATVPAQEAPLAPFRIEARAGGYASDEPLKLQPSPVDNSPTEMQWRSNQSKVSIRLFAEPVPGRAAHLKLAGATASARHRQEAKAQLASLRTSHVPNPTHRKPPAIRQPAGTPQARTDHATAPRKRLPTVPPTYELRFSDGHPMKQVQFQSKETPDLPLPPIPQAGESPSESEMDHLFDEPPTEEGTLPPQPNATPEDADFNKSYGTEPLESLPAQPAPPMDAEPEFPADPEGLDGQDEGEDSQGSDRPRCDRVYNDRSCCDEDEDCHVMTTKLRQTTLKDISLDISPPFDPLTKDRGEADKRKRELMNKSPSRAWTDRFGNVLATGRLVDFRNGSAMIQTESGEELPLRFMMLADDEQCFITSWWNLPAYCAVDEAYEIRDWTYSTFTWTASALCHKPLYFEDVQLERYGHSTCPSVQPFLSGAHFFANLILLPYSMGMYSPKECQYALGYYRPGSCAPWLIPAFPLSFRGAVAQAGFIGGIYGLFP